MSSFSPIRFGQEALVTSQHENSAQRPVSLTVHLKELEEVSRSHAALVRSREKLLVQRQQFRTSGKVLREKRIEAGDAEAKLMSALREYVSLHQESLPANILAAYEKVDSVRTDLGVQEDDYLQAESELTGAEWTFTDEETEFYEFGIEELLLKIGTTAPYQTSRSPSPVVPQNMYHPDGYKAQHQIPPPPPPPPPPPCFDQPTSRCGVHKSHLSLTSNELSPLPPSLPSPPPLVQPHSAESSSGDLLVPPPPECKFNRELDEAMEDWSTSRREFDELRQKQASRIDQRVEEATTQLQESLHESDTSPFMIESSEVIDRMINLEVEVQRLKIKASVEGEGTISRLRRHSAPHPREQIAPPTANTLTVAQSESAVPTLAEDPSTLQRILDWLFHYLTENAVEHALYRNIAKVSGIRYTDKKEWQQIAKIAKRYWKTETPEDLVDFDEQSSAPDHVNEIFGSHDPSKLSGVHGNDPKQCEDFDKAGKEVDLQSNPQMDGSGVSTIVKDQALFETFTACTGKNSAEGDFIAPPIVDETPFPRALTPVIVLRPPSPPLRKDSPQIQDSEPTKVGSIALYDYYNSSSDLSPPHGAMVDKTQQTEADTWLCVNQSLTDNEADNEVPAEYLTKRPLSAGDTIIDPCEPEESHDRKSFFGFFMRPRSKSDSRDNQDQPGARHRLPRNHKRHSSAYARLMTMRR